METWLTVRQAAAILGMHDAAVRRAILAGRLRATRLGARLLVLTPAEVARYQRERPRRGPKPGRRAAGEQAP